MSFLILMFGLLLPFKTWAYPQFIGYKYASCITCHYNSQGNGPLNDYGRALWATEIAGRMFAGKATDEELGERSGFLGKTQLPYWIRPGLKARQLWIQSNPGSKLESSRDILMQAEANLALFIGKSQKYAVVGSMGYVPERVNDPDTWISREHYFRLQATEKLWIYTGMMDKVYGIRHVNHTAYSRSRTGLAQNDQSHGVMVHYINPKWELTVNGFLGNLNQRSELRQQGFSSLFEYDLKDNWRIGATFLNSKNDFVSQTRFGVLSRAGYGKGSAILFESGLIQDKPEVGDSVMGYYVYSEAQQRVKRGYHVFVTSQAYKRDLSSDVSDELKFGFGLLAFPMQRLELRVEAENSQLVSAGPNVPRYGWSVLGQIHLSL